MRQKSRARGAWLLVVAALVGHAQAAYADTGAEPGSEDAPKPALPEEKRSGDAIPAGNPEFGPDTKAPEPSLEDRLKVEAKVGSELHTYENLDLRARDESNDQAVFDTDDRHTFAYSTGSLLVGYEVERDLTVQMGVSLNGLWAEDQLGQAAQLVGPFYFSQLSLDWSPIKTDSAEVGVRLGRHPFKIGGVPSDYVMDDILDSLVLTLDLKKLGAVRWLALDFFQANDLPNAAFVRYVGGRQPVLGLRGDTYTLRTGAIYENEGDLVDGLTFKAYAFYADIGGGPIDETGADVSYGGALGNFSDNDYTALFGARAAYELKTDSLRLNFYGEFNQSTGLDRKEVVARDVETVGSAFGAGVEAEFKASESLELHAGAEFYLFDGANYASDGLEFERGFVSFRGRRVGGLTVSRYAGWFPSAVLGTGGIDHSPNSQNRASGTQFLHAYAGIKPGPVLLRADAWVFNDTSESFLDPSKLDDITPPFGYSREEFFAQSRFGKALGTELDVQLRWDATEHLELFGVGSVFLPGEFYEIEINRVANAENPGLTALGSTDPQTFWAATAGALVSF